MGWFLAGVAAGLLLGLAAGWWSWCAARGPAGRRRSAAEAAHRARSAELEGLVATASGERDEHRAESDALRATAAATDRQLAAQRSELSAARARGAVLGARLTRSEVELAAARATVALTTAELGDRQAELDAIRAELRTRRAVEGSLRRQRDDLLADRTAARHAASAADAERERVQSTADGLAADLARLRDRARGLEVRHAEADRERAALLAELDRLRAERVVLTAGDLAPAERGADAGTPPPEVVAVVAAPDDLKVLVGVGPVLERLLRAEGIATFDQVAALDEAALAALAGRRPELADVCERARRDRWVEQARARLGNGRHA